MEKKNPFIPVPIASHSLSASHLSFLKFWVTTYHRIDHQKTSSCLTFSEYRCHVHHSSLLLAYPLTPVKSKHHKCCLPALCLTARLIFSRHLITHMHHMNPRERWHKALFFLSRLKEQVVLHVGRGMNMLYASQISTGRNTFFFFNFPPKCYSTASFADFLILMCFAHLFLMADSPAGICRSLQKAAISSSRK